MSGPGPRLSVVLRVVAGRDGIERCVDALRRQAGRDALEIITPVTEPEALELGPSLRAEVVLAPTAELPRGLARASAVHLRCDLGSAAGFDIARAPVIASLEDTAQPSADWFQAICEAHASWPHEVIGGPIDVEAGDAAAWAAFWLDFAPHVPPRERADVAGLSDVNASYKRHALMAVRDIWARGFNEFVVHRAFQARGYRFLMLPAAGVTLQRPSRAWSAVLAERFWWGRVFGAARREVLPTRSLAVRALAAPVLPALMAARVARRVVPRAVHRRRLLGAVPSLLACGAAWCGGELIGELTGEPF